MNFEQSLKKLELKRDCSMEEVKKKVRQLILKYHPDLNPDNEKFCEEKTKEILLAYHIILKNKDLLETPKTFDITEDIEKKEEFLTVLIFKINKERFAISIKNIMEIINAKNISLSRINIDKEIFGYFNWRGRVVPIININKKLMMKEETDHNFLVVINSSKGLWGIFVDKVIEIGKIKNQIIFTSPLITITRYKDEPLFIIDTNKIS